MIDPSRRIGSIHTFPWGTHGSRRRIVRRNSSGLAAAHAWGEHDDGYGTGNGTSSRARPLKSSGSRKPWYLAASSMATITLWAVAAVSVQRVYPKSS